MDDEILGYVVCKTCMKPKSIKQGKGKRKAFVHGRCECGPDTRTGAAAQVELKAFKPLAEVEAEIEALKQPKPEPVSKPIPEPKPEPVEPKPTETKTEPMGTVTCVGVGAVTGLIFGAIIKSLKAVA
ncbi:hypothetical protein LL266_16805 [Vibrio anguillarum]|uniref:hypothetical protein n=1 Tax=Vibrio anguillarum TaxID=55601 RepID=UPI001D192B18|nr:hypothetical protein [Vibrio anguillarum]MCC4238151.1 hypothetical protein [Vibrio anguillarum]